MSAATLRVRPDAGPTHPPSSARDAGLVPGTVLRYDLAAVAGSVPVAGSLVIEPGTAYRVAIYPAVSFLDAGPDPMPDWGSLMVGVKFVIDGEQFAATDQHGHWFVPTDPGCLIADQWNLLDLDLSGLVGRRVDEVVLVGDDGASGYGWLQVIGPTPLPTPGHEPLDWVRTARGTHSGFLYSRGNTFPTTCVPHGAHFLTPVTDARTRSWLYSWHPDQGRTRPSLQALAFAHAPSPWIADRNAFQLMPWTGEPLLDPKARALAFSHEDEWDRPHHYRVRLDSGITAEATPTSRCGFFRFHFPDAARRGVLLDQPGDGTVTWRRLPDGRASFTAAIAPPTGFRSAPERPMPPSYVYGETLQPVRVRPLRAPRSLVDGKYCRGRALADTVLGRLRLVLPRRQSASLELLGGDLLEVKVAMSFIGTEQARHNLDLEIGTKGFDDVLAAAHDQWDALLGRLSIEGATHDQLISAYSNLARLFSWPNAHHENAGTDQEPNWVYASPFRTRLADHTSTHTGCQVVEGRLYVNNGYWDTYRTAWPAYHLLTPERAPELLDGILAQYTDSGYMSRWSAPGHVDCMVGTSSDAIFADAAAHGLAFDELTAYDSALKDAGVPSPDRVAGRNQIARARFTGWVDSSEPEGFSWSVENANCDAAIGLWSARLAARADDLGVAERHGEFVANSHYFTNRSLALADLFDPAVGFWQGRRPDGHPRVSRDDFDPRIWGYDYTETNAWGMAFSGVHDGAGLARLYGGPAALAEQEPASARTRGWYSYTTHEMAEARNTRLGMVAMSNQPAHHIPFMFLHADQPWRTQWLTREILDRLFTGSEIGQGYPGDEDNGQMSAWWLFAAFGLYPLQVGSGEMVITAPLFERMSWRISDTATLTVIGHGAAQGHRYIQGVSIDQTPWDTVAVPVEVLAAGATVEVWLGPVPSDWGRGSRPASPAVPRLPDLTGTAHVNLTDRRGRDHVADSLVDDRGDSMVEAEAGAVLTVRWGSDVRPSFFTLTTEDAGPPDFELDYLTGPDWHAIDLTPNRPRFANQPVPTMLPAGLTVRGLRWRFARAHRLRQIEVF